IKKGMIYKLSNTQKIRAIFRLVKISAKNLKDNNSNFLIHPYKKRVKLIFLIIFISNFKRKF
ncbi:hypothetical protein VF04_19115, partial [Nostoc linckia z7]